MLPCLWALILAFTVGCGGGTGSSPERATYPASVSAVNGWPLIDPNEYAKDLSDNGLGLVELEGFPWVDRSSPCDDAHPTNCGDPYRVQRRALLKAMSAHKITVYINLSNANSTFARRMTDAQVLDEVQSINSDVAATGATVWLGPLSEPWVWHGSGPQHRAEIIRAAWAGVFVVADYGANQALGRPYFDGVRYDYLEVHPCALNDALSAMQRGSFVVTDCSPILNPGPEVSAGLLRQAMQAGRPLVIYDHFAVKPDVGTMVAMGAEIR